MGLCSQIVILVIVTFFASSKVFAEHSNSSATKESPTRQLTSTEIFQILGRRSKSFLSGEICYEDFTKDEVTLAEIDSLTDEDLWFMVFISLALLALLAPLICLCVFCLSTRRSVQV